MNITLFQIAKLVNGKVEGNLDLEISGVAEIQNAKKGDITFLSNPNYLKSIYTTGATAVIVSNSLSLEKPVEPLLIRVEDPYSAFAELLRFIDKLKSSRKPGISQSAIIDNNAKIAESAFIGEHVIIEEAVVDEETQIHNQVYIGKGVRIGKSCMIHSGAKIQDGSIIGDYCEIHSGAIIGSDGFGYAPQSDGSYQKIPQLGNVIIENHVSIGANSTIDRATLSSTIIREGVKIDNLVQVAHNCEIGKNTVIAAQVGIAGSTTIGAYCMIGGQAGISGHISIADYTKIGPKSGVMSSIKEEGQSLLGAPGMDVKEYFKVYAAGKKLPELIKKIRALEKYFKH